MTTNETATIKMTETAIAVQATINPALYQLGLAKGNVSGVVLTQVNTAIMLVDQVMETIIVATNQDADDYDSLLTTCEELDNQLVAAQLRLKDIDDLVGDANLAKAEAIAEKEETALKIKAIRINLEAFKDECKRLEALKPDETKNKLAEAKRAVADKTKILQQQKLDIRTLKTQKEELKACNSTATKINLSLANKINVLEKQLNLTSGNTSQKVFTAVEDKKLEFFIHYNSWGLYTVGNGTRKNSKFIEDLDWHMTIRTNYAVDCLVRATKWISPCVPELDIFPLALHIPKEMFKFLHEELYKQIEESHPHLVARVDWAKTITIDEIKGIKEKHIQPLIDAEYITLYDIVECMDKSLERNCKGIGSAAEKEIRSACEKMVTSWEVEHSKLREAA